MLIINVISDDKIKFKGRFFKKQVRPEAFQRYLVRIGEEPCTIIEFNECMLPTLNLQQLFKAFKGKVLASKKNYEKLVPIEYRFDFKPYYKRALLSSLMKTFDENDVNLSISIKDDDFVLSNEYLEISKMAKQFKLVSKDSRDTEIFCNKSFVEYGLFVRMSSFYHPSDEDIFLDLDAMDDSGKVIITKQGKSQLLYPDPQYFSLPEDMRAFLKYGISPKLLCAAFEAIQYQKNSILLDI